MEDAEINVRCGLEIGSRAAGVRSPGRANKLASGQPKELIRYVLYGEMHLIVTMAVEVSVDDDSIMGGRIQQVTNGTRGHNTKLPSGSVLMSKWWCRLDHVQFGDVSKRAWKTTLNVIIHDVLNSCENGGMLDQHTSEHHDAA